MKKFIWPLACAAFLMCSCAVNRSYTVENSNSIPAKSINGTGGQEEGCKVLETSLAGVYSGGCMNGLAHGEGVAKGVDEYRGGFQKGLPSGRGTYIWKDGTSYIGEWKDGKRSGYGEMSFPKASKNIETYENGPPHARGKWVQDKYVVKGLFFGHDKGSLFYFYCESKSACGSAYDEFSLKYFSTKGSPVMWRRCELGRTFDFRQYKCIGTSLKFNWVDAIAAVNRMNSSKFEGYSDWRLPDANDLKVLLQGDARTMSEIPKFLARKGNSRGWDEVRACTYANEFVQDIFTKYGSQGGTFYDTQHWLADNDSTWQSPISFNLESSFGMSYHGYCNVANIAFSTNRPQEMRVHAEIPVIVVRGGTSNAWITAQAALSQRAALVAKSQEAGAQTAAYYGGKIAGVVEWIRKNSAGAASESDTQSSKTAGPNFEIYKDRGTPPSWAWNSREIDIKCTRGRSVGDRRTVYQNRGSGSWTAANVVGNYPTMGDAATRACEI